MYGVRYRTMMFKRVEKILTQENRRYVLLPHLRKMTRTHGVRFQTMFHIRSAILIEFML